MYERFLPSFKVVEINNSTAHRIGHAISQVPCYEGEIAHVTLNNKYKFIENGVIVKLAGDYTLKNYNSESDSCQPCLVYNDELITGPINTLDKYAEEFPYVVKKVDGADVYEYKAAYVRALPLYLGDTFTTNNFAGKVADGTRATVVNGILTIGSEGPFIAKSSTLPNGDPAVEFTYIG